MNTLQKWLHEYTNSATLSLEAVQLQINICEATVTQKYKELEQAQKDLLWHRVKYAQIMAATQAWREAERQTVEDINRQHEAGGCVRGQPENPEETTG